MPATFSAGAESSAMEARTSDEHLAIYVTGPLIGEVSSVVPTIDGVVAAPALNKLFGMVQRSNHLSKVEVVPDKVWRTLVADRGSDGEQAPGSWQTACQYLMETGTVNDRIDTIEQLQRGQPHMERAYLKRVQEVVWDRCFIEVVSRGISMGVEERHGLGPTESHVGDVISILYGCTVPCLLRESPWVPGSYRPVGECYVYGLMDGEAITCRSEEALERDKMVFRIV
ncbi:hypothetical protein LTR95_004150 [Oleoguttula sp. CCFEE 5521]